MLTKFISRTVSLQKYFAEKIAMVIMLVITLSMFIRVVMRQLSISTYGIAPNIVLLNIWAVFLLVGPLALKQEHLKVQYFLRKDIAYKRELMIFISIVGLIFSTGMMYASYVAILEFSGNVVSETGIPMEIYFLAPFVGFFLAMLVYIHNILEFGGYLDS